MRTRASIAQLVLVLAAASALATTPEDQLLEAIRQSDVAAVKKLLDGGVSANAKYRYDRSALSFAADRGNVEIVTLLLDRGASVDAKDTYYKMTPLSSAAMKGNAEIVRLLLARSPQGAGSALTGGIFGKKPEVVSAVLASARFTPRDLSYALQAAERASSTEAIALLKAAGAVPPPAADAKVAPETLARYAGVYRSADEELTLAVADGALTGTYKSSGFSSPLAAIDGRRFVASNALGVTLDLLLEGERVTGVEVASIGSVARFERVTEVK